jgi:hypothetical protein
MFLPINVSLFNSKNLKKKAIIFFILRIQFSYINVSYVKITRVLFTIFKKINPIKL